MSVIRVNKTKDYTVMSNHHLKNMNLSLKAKGLLSQMLSLPDDWDYSIAGLAAINKENESSIKSALGELKQEGYLTITKLMPDETGSGRIEYIYDIFEQPQKQEGKKQGVEIQPLEILPVEIQPVENQGQLNTNNINTKESNTKELNTNVIWNKSRFIPPTLEEVIAYCQERNNNVDAQKFFPSYEASGWKVGRDKMKSWKAAVIYWERSSYDKPMKQKPQPAENPFTALKRKEGRI